eukprot:7183594-Alexandrium_andersonii.AAC.1
MPVAQGASLASPKGCCPEHPAHRCFLGHAGVVRKERWNFLQVPEKRSSLTSGAGRSQLKSNAEGCSYPWAISLGPAMWWKRWCSTLRSAVGA